MLPGLGYFIAGFVCAWWSKPRWPLKLTSCVGVWIPSSAVQGAWLCAFLVDLSVPPSCDIITFCLQGGFGGPPPGPGFGGPPQVPPAPAQPPHPPFPGQQPWGAPGQFQWPGAPGAPQPNGAAPPDPRKCYKNIANGFGFTILHFLVHLLFVNKSCEWIALARLVTMTSGGREVLVFTVQYVILVYWIMWRCLELSKLTGYASILQINQLILTRLRLSRLTTNIIKVKDSNRLKLPRLRLRPPRNIQQLQQVCSQCVAQHCPNVVTTILPTIL